MVEDVFDPLERYQSDYSNRFSQVVAETFNSLVEQAGVDREANAILCREIARLEAEKAKREGKAARYKWLRVAVVVAILIVVGYSCNQYSIQGWDAYSILAIPLTLLLGYLVFFVLNPFLRNLKATIEKKEAEIKKLTAEAWEQMKPLNDLYDWGITTRMIESVIPKLDFDSFVHQGRISELIDDYNLADLPDNQSVVAAQSGVINENPFVIAQLLSQEWNTKTYYGSIVITWRESVRGPDGKITYITRSQTLTASVNAPIPEYQAQSCLIYGNDAAPNLSFMRNPSKHSGDSNGFLANMSKRRSMKRLRKFSQNLEDESQYTLMSNHEFELLFETMNRTDEQEYRLLFTPLAQRQMLSLINDTSVGYGDDFSFRKERKINVITAEHLNEQPLDTCPSRYHDYNLERAEGTFNRFNVEFFKAIYFAFAPLLSIPLYQQMKPLRKIYGESEKQCSSWELESLANYYGANRFRGSDFETDSILKVKMSERDGQDGKATVTAHSFYSEPRVSYVPMLGGDGNFHQVPVEWREYFPTTNISSIMVREFPEDDLKTIDKSFQEDFFSRLSMKAGDNALARRNILSGILYE